MFNIPDPRSEEKETNSWAEFSGSCGGAFPETSAIDTLGTS